MVAPLYLKPASEILYFCYTVRRPEILPLGLLNILACPIYTKHFQLCCIKHVTGLFVSLHFNNPANGPVFRSQRPKVRRLIPRRKTTAGGDTPSSIV